MHNTYGPSHVAFDDSQGSLKKASFIPETNGWKIRRDGAILNDDVSKVQVFVVALFGDWTENEKKWFMLLLELLNDSRQEYKRIGLAALEADFGRKLDIERD